MSEFFAFLGYPARIAGRVPLLARYLSSGYSILSRTSTYAQARFGMSYRWRPWLLPDLNDLEGIEDLVNAESDEKVIAFKDYQLSACQMIAVIGALVAQAGLSALSLSSLEEMHFTARGCFIISMIIGLVATFCAALQQRTFGNVSSADEVRAWLSSGKQYENHQGLLRYKASIVACQILQVPFELVCMSITAFIIGFGLYLGFAMHNELVLSLGPNANRTLFIFYLIITVFPLAVTGLLLGAQDMEQLKLAGSTDYVPRGFGPSAPVAGNTAHLFPAEVKSLHPFAGEGQQGAPRNRQGEDANQDLKRALLEAAAAHRQCAKANEEVAMQPTSSQRAAAATPDGRRKRGMKLSVDSTAFPAPLVLPDDDLSMDPEYPPQSVREWLDEGDRNEVTPKRNIVYVSAPPEVDRGDDFIRTWTEPQLEDTDRAINMPSVQNLVDYLTAFYHGITIRLLPPSRLGFQSWNTGTGKKSKRTAKARSTTPRQIGLDTPKGCFPIRTRASKDKLYVRQLNLDDLLDAAISMLPNDAYALLLLVDHDLYEGEDDMFVCGRAYGGSCVAVVSTARYNPLLDDTQEVEREHAWPASHCEVYVQDCCGAAAEPQRPAKGKAKNRKPDSHPPQEGPDTLLRAAVAAYTALPSLSSRPSATALSGLWLNRICRTASHELAHCFGIDHCVYYACIMQGSSSIREDARQPPYLCPVDLAKLLRATGADETERYRVLLGFCERHDGTHGFAAFGAWITARLAMVEGTDSI
ncbi:hypothetical protein H2201_000180 [Coniosporium apollinis]|uniref:Uncharacterized protein n=1 Tax=Coniosporium apollinis TaxID=61459 RepID=A0ABQ9P5E3_9PEZI|nr:hypothetical protein H2201_000180 [Coniosporium apollinis]